MTAPFSVTFTRHEANVLLRSLATANDSERTSAAGKQVNTWLAERLIRAIDDAPRVEVE